MALYAEKIRLLSGEDKIRMFCEIVEVLNLRGHDIAVFAAECKFMESDKVEIVHD